MKKKAISVAVVLAIIAAGYYLYHHSEKPVQSTTLPAERPSPIAKVNPKETKILLDEIRSKSDPTGLRVILIGWDAADWQIADPLIKAGKLPNLKRLIANGTKAYMRSSQPMLSPLLWTSIATGKYATEHGILDFLITDPKTHKPAPINSTFRRSMALWNMLTESGKSSAFVAWWATWPAEHVNGYMVSDRVSYSLFSLGKAPETNLTWPEQYYSEVKSKLVTEKDITDQQLSEFIHLSPSEISKERTVVYPQGKTNPVAYLAEILAGAKNYHDIALDLLSKQKYDLLGCYFESIDQAGHIFQHYMAPKMTMVTDEEYRRYKDVVPKIYEYTDQLTGDLLKSMSSDTVVILTSDHGFKNGAGRPTDFAPSFNERPAYWHRGYGIFVMSGGPVRKGSSIDTVTIYEAAPTILYLLGLPIGKDLPGKVLIEALEKPFAEQHQAHSIASWEPLKNDAGFENRASNVDQDMMENLAALGYIGNNGGSPAESKVLGSENASFHRNLANIYINEKKYDLAEKEVNKSMEMGVAFETYEYLFEIKKAQNLPDQAGQAMEQGLQKFPDFPPEAFMKLIDLYVTAGRVNDAQRVYEQFAREIKAERFKLHCSARLKEGQGDFQGAANDYLASLRVDPTFSYSMERLFSLYEKHGDIQQLEIPLRTGLTLNDQLPFYHNALGVIYKRRGDYAGAVQEYEKAINADPDNSTYWANLGAAYLSLQKLNLAEEALLRAKSKDEKDPEVWLNLGAIYGRMGRLDEALAAFQKVKDLGVRSPNVELGIAVTLAQKGQIQDAIKTVETALRLYPDYPELRELLSELKQRGG